MPNIEICGFGLIEARRLKNRIDEIIQSIGLGSEAMTSIAAMKTESCDSKKIPMPYIRVCSTDSTEVKKIVQALKNVKIGVDVECLVLDGFIPAAEMS